MSNRRKRVTLYVRLSNERTDRNLSLEGMTADLRELADEIGAEIMEPIRTDDGISGAVRDRPGFQAWLADIHDGADVALSWSADRLTREGFEVGQLILDACWPGGAKGAAPRCRLVTYDDGFDTDRARDYEDFRSSFLSAAESARKERYRYSRRNKARVRRMLAEGRHVGKIPFGYRLDPDRPAVLVVDQEEAATAAEMMRRVLAGDYPSEVARWLNASGVPTHSGKPWARQTVLQVLTSKSNAGEPLAAGTEGREPILSYADVAEVTRRFERKPAELDPVTGQPKRGGARDHTRGSQALLGGLIVCHDCLQPLRSSSGRYTCMTKADGGICGGAVSVTRGIAERDVLDFYDGTFGRLPEVRHVVRDTAAGERDALEREQAALLRDMAKGFTPELGARLAEVQARRVELDGSPVEREATWVPTGRTWSEALVAQPTTEGKRSELRRVLDRVICWPRTHKPRLTMDTRQEAVEAVAEVVRGLAEAAGTPSATFTQRPFPFLEGDLPERTI
jgi:DNA invertase Pin-like site-specific DNA recombinase